MFDRLWRTWQAQRRILGALLLREIVARWGRRNLGFGWIVAEPLLFAFPVLVLWSFMRSPYEHGISMIAFTWSGYLPLLMFRHVSGRSLLVIRQNAAMLYHRSITPLDLVIARCGLELLGSISAAVVSFTVFYMFGWLPWPKDMGMLLLGFFYMAWWSFAVGLIVAGGSERSEMVEHIWMTISYVYIPISGFMYLAQWLPASVRGLALAVLPSLHSYEMIRSGVFGNNIQTFYNVAYVSFYLAVLTVIGLWLIHSVRRHLEIEF